MDNAQRPSIDNHRTNSIRSNFEKHTTVTIICNTPKWVLQQSIINSAPVIHSGYDEQKVGSSQGRNVRSFLHSQ